MLKPLLIAVLALALVAAAVFVGGKYWGEEATDETAGWQTYRNEEYGYEFRYPSEWVIEGARDLVMAMPREFQEDKRSMMLTIATVNIGRESVFDAGANLNIIETSFAGRRSKLYTCPDDNPCPVQLAYSKAVRLEEYPVGWDQFNEISFNLNKGFENLIPTYNQVLDSFVFTR